MDFQIFLDRRAWVLGVYESGTDKTHFVLPYHITNTDDRAKFRVCLPTDHETAAGALLALDSDGYEWTASDTVKVVGDCSGYCWVGFLFTSRHEFSQQYMRNGQNIPVLGGSFILNSYVVHFTDTAFFRTEVSPHGDTPDIEAVSPAHLAEFDGKTIGDSALLIGAPAFGKGEFRFEIYGDSTLAKVALLNDSHLASTFTQAEYEGNYKNRSRTV